MGAVRGYEENLYIAGWNRASSCWCKEKSSTVGVKKTPQRRGERGPLLPVRGARPDKPGRQTAGASSRTPQGEGTPYSGADGQPCAQHVWRAWQCYTPTDARAETSFVVWETGEDLGGVIWI